MGRTVAAILENYQQADGTVVIPEVYVLIWAAGADKAGVSVTGQRQWPDYGRKCKASPNGGDSLNVLILSIKH